MLQNPKFVLVANDGVDPSDERKVWMLEAKGLFDEDGLELIELELFVGETKGFKDEFAEAFRVRLDGRLGAIRIEVMGDELMKDPSPDKRDGILVEERRSGEIDPIEIEITKLPWTTIVRPDHRGSEKSHPSSSLSV